MENPVCGVTDYTTGKLPTKGEKSEWGRKLQEEWVKKTTKKQRKQWSKKGNEAKNL